MHLCTTEYDRLFQNHSLTDLNNLKQLKLYIVYKKYLFYTLSEFLHCNHQDKNPGIITWWFSIFFFDLFNENRLQRVFLNPLSLPPAEILILSPSLSSQNLAEHLWLYVCLHLQKAKRVGKKTEEQKGIAYGSLQGIKTVLWLVPTRARERPPVALLLPYTSVSV